MITGIERTLIPPKRQEAHRRDDTPIDPGRTYSFALYDYDTGRYDFEPRSGLTLWELRRAIQDAERRGYSSVSYSIDLEMPT